MPTLAQLYYRRPSLGKAQTSFPYQTLRLYSYARQAMVKGLQLLGFEKDSVLLLPSFICRDVLAPAHALAGKVAFYDVNEQLQPIDPCEKWPKADVVVAVNYFGFPQPLEPFERFCKLHGARLLEDNAHGFLSRDAQGRWLGMRSDVGIFSLRKTLPLGVGAALYHKAAESHELELTGKSPLKREILRKIKYGVGYLASRSDWLARGLTGALTLDLTRKKQSWLTLDSNPEYEVPHAGKIHNSLKFLLKDLDVAAEIERRRTLYEALLRHSRQFHGIVPIFGELTANICPYMFVFIPQNDKSLVEFTHFIRGQGLRLIRWPDLPLAVRERCPSFYTNIWAVPFMW